MKSLRPLKIVLLVVCLIVLPIGTFWLGWRWLDANNRGNDMISEGRFDQLKGALLHYHQEYGTFPPTRYQPVVDGPIHSWRVLLFPIFGRTNFTYDFAQRWNSSTNLPALGQTAPGFLRVNGEGDTTHYLAIGEGDEWPSRKPLRSLLVKVGKDQFLLVEYPDSNIHWMEPKY